MENFEPFISAVAEHYSTITEIKNLRIDRDTELRDCINFLCNRNENLLLFGLRGVGKTFLGKLVSEEIKTNFKDTFTIFISLMADWFSEDIFYNLPKIVPLELCVKIWKSIFNNKYSTLRNTLEESGQEIKFRNKQEKKIIEIYKLLMSTGRKNASYIEGQLGISTIIKGHIKEGVHREFSAADVYPFEFFEYIEEIKTEILLPNKINRVVIICDDVNKLADTKQNEILERYLELFSTRNIQFLIVVGYHVSEKVNYLSSGFQNIVELNGFSKKSYIKEFINRYNKQQEIRFQNDAIDVVWEVFNGHPRNTLSVCQTAYEKANNDNKKEIDNKLMTWACNMQLQRIEEYKKM